MKTKSLWLCVATMLVTSTASVAYYLKHESKEQESGEYKEENGRALTGVDRQLAMWLFAKGYPDPAGLSDKYRSAWQQHLDLRKNTTAYLHNNTLNRTQSTASNGNWTSIGPKVFGGRILCLAINPLLNLQSNNTVWAGSASGGIWRSYNGASGATAWHPVTTGTSVLGVASIAIHPTDTNTVIAGTGEVYRVETVVNGANSTNQTGNNGRGIWKCRGTYGIGILKTTDGGANWTNVYPKNSAELFAIQKVKFDPNDGNKVYACATDGLYRSLDGGNSWANIYPATFVSDIVINPANSNQIVFSIGNMNNSVKGIWRTLDGFTTPPLQLTTGLPTAFEGFITFDFQGTTLAAAYGRATSPSTNDLYTSTNFGTTWTTRTSTSFSGGQYWIAHDVELNPSGLTAILGGVQTYRYTFSSSSLTQIATGGNTINTNIAPGGAEGNVTGSTSYLHDDVHDIEFIPGSTTTFYAATDGGIFKSTNNGTDVFAVNGGLQVAQFYSPAASSATTGVLIGGLQDNCVVRYDGTNWRKVLNGDGGPCMFKPGDETIVIASNDARSIWQSTSSGTASTGFANRLANMGQSWLIDEKTCFMAPMGVSNNAPARMYVASDNLHISTNSGGSFSKNTQASISPGTPIEMEFKPGFAIGVSNADAMKLYIAMSPLSQKPNDDLYYNPPATIRKSIDGGTTFTTVSTGLPDRYVTDFAISDTEDDSVFITLGGFGTTHIYVSSNGGASWTPRGSGLPDVPFNSLMFDPVNANILYAASDFGVYVSPDRGQNWFDFNNGLWDATYVIDLVSGPGNKIRAVTHGKGVFEASLYTMVTLPVKIKSFQGMKQDADNLLQWTVTDEAELLHYILERSSGENHFKPLATLKATGNRQYSYNDPNVSGPYYYRLRAVNKDGSYTYSDVVYVDREAKNVLQVYGNPFSDQISIKLVAPGAGKIRINLYDMKGRLLKTDALESWSIQTNHTIYGLRHLPAGMYQLEAVAGKKRWTQKLIKK